MDVEVALGEYVAMRMRRQAGEGVRLQQKHELNDVFSETLGRVNQQFAEFVKEGNAQSRPAWDELYAQLDQIRVDKAKFFQLLVGRTAQLEAIHEKLEVTK